MHASWAAFVRGGDASVPALPAWPTYRAARDTMILARDPHVVANPAAARRRTFASV